jgi:glycosyltransferase involved in cell wall biosynthesis
MLNVAHITNVIDGRNNSGTARVARELIYELSKREGITQYLIHFEKSNDPIYSLNNCIEILLPKSRLPMGSRLISFLFFSLSCRINRKYHFDVTHWHVARIYPFFYLLPTKKTIVTIHDAGNYILPNVMDIPNRIYRFIYEFHQNKIESFLAVSKNAKENLIKYSKINAMKIQVIYPGTHILNLKVKAVPLKVDIHQKKLILCVSRWQPHKKVERLVKAFAYISNIYSDSYLILVGKPVNNHSAPLDNLKNLRSNSFEVLHDLSDEEIAFLYRHAYINVFPSIHEGFGLSVLEAMSYGCPSIIHNGTATSEIAGKSGIAINMNDEKSLEETLSNILGNDRLRAQLSKECTILKKKFNWDSFATQIMNLYLGKNQI